MNVKEAKALAVGNRLVEWSKQGRVHLSQLFCGKRTAQVRAHVFLLHCAAPSPPSPRRLPRQRALLAAPLPLACARLPRSSVRPCLQLLGGSASTLWYTYVFCLCKECENKPILAFEEDDENVQDANPEIARERGQGIYNFKHTRIMNVVQFMLHAHSG